MSILRGRTDLRPPPNARETNNRLKIILGDTGLEIIVPKALICSKSVYFHNACSKQDEIGPSTTNLPKTHEDGLSGHKQPECRKITGGHDSVSQSTVANTVRLKNVDANIFSIFLAWAVTGALEEAQHFFVDVTESKEKTCSKGLQLIECYIVGEKIRAEDFKNHVIDRILTNEKSLLYDFGASSLVAQVVERIYSNTPVGSPLRRYIVDVTIFTIPKDLVSLIPEHNPNVEYLRDCFREYQRVTCTARESLQGPWEKHPCDYHDHSDRPLGYRCRT